MRVKRIIRLTFNVVNVESGMLDFIVLGIVPGTKFVLTLRWVLLIALAINLTALAYIEFTKFKASAGAAPKTRPSTQDA